MSHLLPFFSITLKITYFETLSNPFSYIILYLLFHLSFTKLYWNILYPSLSILLDQCCPIVLSEDGSIHMTSNMRATSHV